MNSKKRKKQLFYSALGKAKIKESKNSILVKNLKHSGIDGVSIDVSAKEKHDFYLNNVEIVKDKALNISHFGLDYLGRMKCLFQQSICYKPEKEAVAFAINSKLLPNRFTLVGELNGKVVFRSECITPRDNPKVNWAWVVWGIISGAATYIVDKIDYEEITKTITDADGNTTTETISRKSFGGSIHDGNGGDNGDDGSVEKAVCYMTNDGIQFVADNLYIEYKNTTNGCVPLSKLKQIQMNTHNIEEFEMKL